MVANTLLTVNQITRKALMILEQKLNFISNMNRQYDDSFGQTGAKIGDTLRIRLPNQYVVTDGAPLVMQDTTEKSITLSITNQKHVGMGFSSKDLTLSLDDFTSRILDPAMSVLSASMEAAAFTMLADIPYQVGAPGTPPTELLTYLQAKSVMDTNLAPMDNQRRMIIPPLFEAQIVNSLKGLFQDSSQVAKQYLSGSMGKSAGFDWYTNTLLPSQLIGNLVTGVTLGALPPDGATTLTFGGTTASGSTYKKGQTFTLGGVYAVNPQTKAPTADLVKFVVTANVTSTGTTVVVPVWPALVLTGPYQNLVAMPTASNTVSFAAAVNVTYAEGIGFHKDAFTFATADLIMPQGMDFAAREVWQGLSMRIIRDYDINTDVLPTRCDVLFGYKTLRPELAVRVSG